MSQRKTPTGFSVRRSHEPNRLADRQLALAYEPLLSIMANAPPPANFGVALVSVQAALETDAEPTPALQPC